MGLDWRRFHCKRRHSKIRRPSHSTKTCFRSCRRTARRCHRPGEIAPMSFLTYKDTRPWAQGDQGRRDLAADAALVCRSRHTATLPTTNAERRRDQDACRVGRRRTPEGNAKDAPAPRVFHDGWNITAGHDHRNADGCAAAGNRNHQLQEHPREGELHGRPLGRRRGNAPG